jgi:uncharacterized membrane protein
MVLAISSLFVGLGKGIKRGCNKLINKGGSMRSMDVDERGREEAGKASSGTSKRWETKSPYLVPFILWSAFLFFLGIIAPGASHGQGASAPSGQNMSHPIKAFEGGKARFYEYKAPGGITIKYFILQSPDGMLRAAFDACDVCWPEGKGYKQKGEYMVCQNCGKKFASVRVGEVQGGCNPAPLKREVAGDQLAIKVKDLLEGKKYFSFARKG